MLNFLHTFTPTPIIFQLGPLTFRYYGLIIASAILVAILVALKIIKSKEKPTDDLWDLAFWLVLAGIIGARAYEVLILAPGYFFANPAEIIKIWQGGLAIHGAIIAGIATLIIWCRYKKQSFWLWADVGAIVLPLAQAIGRWGNYFNQEVFGLPTNLPWGIPIELVNRPAQFINNQYFHPTFLYESVLNLILFVVLFGAYRISSKKEMGSFIRHGGFRMTILDGQYLGVYLIGYGLIRFLMEFIRIDQTALLFGFRWPQIFSLILILIGVVIIYKKKTPA